MFINIRVAAKKVIFLMAVPLREGGGKGLPFRRRKKLRGGRIFFKFYEKVPTAIKLEGHCH